MNKKKRAYIIQSSLAMCLLTILALIASIKFASAEQLTFSTKLAIWGFFLIIETGFVIIMFRAYKKIDDLDQK